MRALGEARQWLAVNGITEARHLDMWTALVTGLVEQQISNDPGGDRWIRLLDEAMVMFLAHCRPTRIPSKPSPRQPRIKGARS